MNGMLIDLTMTQMIRRSALSVNCMPEPCPGAVSVPRLARSGRGWYSLRHLGVRLPRSPSTKSVLLRLLGTNLTFAGAFPPKEAAPLLAGHLRKLGMNVVRFHHVDMGPAPRGLWLPDFSGLDPQQMDRLDWLIYQLKQHGIYVNLNLHVSRTYPGVPAGVQQAFKYGKGLDNFYPPFIRLQEDYARLLLTHRNPYTQTTYAGGPAVAVIEINNENSLTHISGSAMRIMPEPFKSGLRKQWWKCRSAALRSLSAVWRACTERGCSATSWIDTDTGSTRASRRNRGTGATGTSAIPPWSRTGKVAHSPAAPGRA